MQKRPPRLAQRFFCWYCKNRLRDSILGDLNEQFYQNQIAHGNWTAQIRYWISVMGFINRFTLKRDRNSTSNNYYATSMIKNNLISSLRFLARNKGFTSINILGLTLGFTSFLLILFFVNHELSFDQFHQDKEQVFRLNFSFEDNAGNVTTLVNSPPALAPGISGKFPELEKISRMRYASNALFSNGNTQFYENGGYYADSMFLEILPFEFVYGDQKTALDKPNSIVITEALALKYFDTPNPIGSTLEFNKSVPLKVTGVLSSIPSNSHLNFDFLISFSTYTVPEGYASDLTSWSWLGFLTYVKLKPNADPVLFEKKLAQYIQDLNPDNPNPMLPIVQHLSDIYLGSAGMVDDLASPIQWGNRSNINILLIVAILILVVAGFNFSNLTNALSINRSKAMGIRKVLGINKKGILSQMFTESLIITFFCLTLSLGVAHSFFPAVSQFMNWKFSLGFIEILSVIPILISVGIFIGIVSGLYPALVLARFDIIKSLKGSLKMGTRNPFQAKNVLILLQFAVSIGLISSTIVMTQQIDYLRNKETGYSAENVVLIKMLPEDLSRYFEVYKERLIQHSAVINVSRSDRVVGEAWPWSIIQRVDQDPEMSKRIFFNQTDYGFFETMGVSFVNGRSFSKEYTNDPSRSIIINQKAAQLMDLDNPIGKQVNFFDLDGPRTIVGVVADFNYTSLHHEIGPAAVILPFIDLEYLYVRFTPDNLRGNIETLESTWKEISSGAPLEWRFLDEDLNRMYHSEEKLSTMIKAFSLLAVFLACLGLLGIITFMINNRLKEVGVRKVLGASVHSLYQLFVKKYIYQILLAMIIILPPIHYLLNTWLEGFAYHININWWIYPVATSLLTSIILITVTFQVLRAAKANPSLLLRNE